jgi:thiol-disulfide isomerase/thioredoxin
MNQTNSIWVAVAIAIVLIGGYLMYNKRPKTDITSNQNNSESIMELEQKEGGSLRGDAMVELTDNSTMQSNKDKNEAMQKSGNYQDYSASRVSTEQAQGNKVVLFFYAPWCPFCRTADAAFKANVGKIPGGVTVLKIDYDSNKELRTKYGVTTQHSFVQIDNNQELVTKWIGGDVDNLIKFIK